MVEHIQDNLPDDANQREHGGFITSQPFDDYSDSVEGTDITGDDTGNVYSYTQKDGGQQWVDLGDPPENAVAGWHSHPSQIQGPNGEWEDVTRQASFFSHSPIVTPRGPGDLYNPREGDIAWVFDKVTPFYLIAPNGEIKLASPHEIARTTSFGKPALRYTGVR